MLLRMGGGERGRMRVESAGEVGVSVEEGKRRKVVRKGRLVVGGDLGLGSRDFEEFV